MILNPKNKKEALPILLAAGVITSFMMSLFLMNYFTLLSLQENISQQHNSYIQNAEQLADELLKNCGSSFITGCHDENIDSKYCIFTKDVKGDYEKTVYLPLKDCIGEAEK